MILAINPYKNFSITTKKLTACHPLYLNTTYSENDEILADSSSIRKTVEILTNH